MKKYQILLITTLFLLKINTVVAQQKDTILLCVVTVDKKDISTGETEKKIEKIQLKIREKGKKVDIWIIDSHIHDIWFVAANYKYRETEEIKDNSNDSVWQFSIKDMVFSSLGTKSDRELSLDRVTGAIKWSSFTRFDSNFFKKDMGKGTTETGYGECNKAPPIVKKF